MTTRADLQTTANKLYKIPEDKLSAIPSVFTKGQLQLLHTATPQEHIHYFPANAGKMAGLAFVTGGYMKHMLDRLTGGMWSFEVKEKGNTSGQIWVLGRVTIYNKDGGTLIFKEQFGRAAIKEYGDKHPKHGEAMDIGNDMKAAATDALKKCASELGIARDIYAANEFLEVEIVDRKEVDDLPTEVESPEFKPKAKVDSYYKKYVGDMLVELYPETYKRTQYLKDLLHKLSLDSLIDYEWQFLCGELEAKKVALMETEEESDDAISEDTRVA